eukprot:15284-Heterococcus_DN1.PRE.1
MLRVISRVSAPVRQRASLATSAAEDTRSKEALRRFAANTPKNAAAARIASAIKAAQSATAQASVHNAAAASSATTAENTSSSSGTRIASSAEQTSAVTQLEHQKCSDHLAPSHQYKHSSLNGRESILCDAAAAAHSSAYCAHAEGAMATAVVKAVDARAAERQLQ